MNRRAFFATLAALAFASKALPAHVLARERTGLPHRAAPLELVLEAAAAFGEQLSRTRERQVLAAYLGA